MKGPVVPREADFSVRLALADTIDESLSQWTHPEEHRDRELSDQMLLAMGWMCQPNAEFGALWIKRGAPHVVVAEAQRPHPVRDLQSAIEMIPDGWYVLRGSTSADRKSWQWVLMQADGSPGGACADSIDAAVALSRAVVKAQRVIIAAGLAALRRQAC